MSLTKTVSCDPVLDIPVNVCLERQECPHDLDLLHGNVPDCHHQDNFHWEPPSVADSADAPLDEAGTSPPLRDPARDWRGLCMSALAHTTLLALVFFLPVHVSTGSGNDKGRAVMVHLIRDEPSMPQDESPGSIDSAASMASVAERKRDAPEERKKHPEKEPSRLEVTHAKELGESAQQIAKEEETVEEKSRKESTSAVKDRQDVESPNKSDSVNSVPSVASAPRIAIPASGAEAADFRASVLSAIEEVAFFPKKALHSKRHGQVVVQFTIHREGPISGLVLVKTSGSEELDRAALRIIERAAEKFPHFPVHLSRESVSYEVPIVFKAAPSRWN